MTATTIFGSPPRPVTCQGSRTASDRTAAIAGLAGLICVAIGGLVLVRSSLPWETALTALAITLCGLVPAELACHRARTVDAPWVSTPAVWVIGALLTLPLAGVLFVSGVLYTHEVLRRPTRVRGDLGRVLASAGGATLAWLAGSVTTGAVAVVLYVAVTEGPVLVRVARRLVAGARPGSHDESTDLAARVALGVLLGMVATVSPLAVVLMLLPVSHLQRAARGRTLRHAAAHDPKTQLLNHAAWQTLSNAALASNRTPTHSAAVLMVDLDHFKRLNDTYGHQAGDDVLNCVAHVLQTTTRRNDIVARFGGEEFSILLPGVTEQEACQAAERIRDQIAALTVITTNLHGRPTTISGITASIGVATTHEADASVEDLLVNADRWLYQAKETGRNRVCGPELAAAA
jgi:diguanylate cyclase (GGDEF)-like protein